MFILPIATDNPGSKPGPVLNAGPIGTTDYPWTMFHYDAQRAGVTPASGPASPRLMWNYTTGSLVYPSAAVADGYVLLPSWLMASSSTVRFYRPPQASPKCSLWIRRRAR